MRGCDRPFLVAIDGPSGAGKSTIASQVAPLVAATIIPLDDFFAADVSNAEWDCRPPARRAADALDWRRLCAEVIHPLRAGSPARWRAFDFAAGLRPDGTYGPEREVTVRAAAPVVILDGAYSSRTELAPLIDLAALVEAPEGVRRARLATREKASFLEQWYARWRDAEEYYFTAVRPATAFDLVLPGATDAR